MPVRLFVNDAVAGRLSLTATAPARRLYNPHRKTASCPQQKPSCRGAIMKRLSVRLLGLLFAGAAMTVLVTAPAGADVVVHIDKYSQRMDVSIDGYPRYSWPVSTGRSGYGTPSGVFHPQMMARRWFSRKYYNSPMPHSIFFYHGFAIHGTTELSRLGGPASHGCVRLHPQHAAALFSLIERDGRSNTRIVIN
jgi:lipoprotein-anchoring transpeptidase ErfK/SrfK